MTRLSPQSDSDKEPQQVLLVPTTLCLSGKGPMGAHVPVERVESYLDLVNEAMVGKDLQTRSKWPESGTPVKDASPRSSNCLMGSQLHSAGTGPRKKQPHRF